MKFGFLGTGLMGQPMAQRLLAAHGAVTVYNRSPEKVQALQAQGATVAESPAALLRSVDCVCLMLSDGAAIRAVLLSPEAQGAIAGRTVIQMGTIAPQESQAIAQSVAAAGGEYLEAPVLGSIPEATQGTLLVMVGSTPEQFDRYRPVLQTFGPEPRYVGEVGTAAALKLALNQLIASLTTAFAQSLGLVQRQGVDPELFMTILRQSALYAPTFDKKLQRMLDRNFDNPNFPTKHMLKDTNLFLQAAEAVGLDGRAIAGVRDIIAAASDGGFADADYSAIFAAVNPEEPR